MQADGQQQQQQQQQQHAVGELDWEEVFSLLQDYGMCPPPPPLSPQPASAAGQHRQSDRWSEGLSGGRAASVPLEEAPGGAMVASLDVFHGAEMEYNAGPHLWEQTCPLAPPPDVYYQQALQYWPQPYPLLAPSMYYGPQGPMYWENPLELDSQAGPYIQDQLSLSYQGSEAELCGHAPSGPPHTNHDGKKVMKAEKKNAPEMLRRSFGGEEEHDQEKRPYVKRPPNAFMLFMKAQRPQVVARRGVRDNAVVNKILGEMWKLMTKKEQAPYYDEARMERQRHKQQHPHWSCKENYGKKRKRERKKVPSNFPGLEAKSSEEK